MGPVSLQETPQSSLAPSHMRTQWPSANQEEGPYRRQVCRPDPRTPPLQNCEEGTSVGRGPGLWCCYRSPNGPDGHLAAQMPSSLVSPRGHLDILVFFDNRTGRQLTHGAGPVVLGPPQRGRPRSRRPRLLRYRSRQGEGRMPAALQGKNQRPCVLLATSRLGWRKGASPQPTAEVLGDKEDGHTQPSGHTDGKHSPAQFCFLASQ